jgi:hypothetical protein
MHRTRKVRVQTLLINLDGAECLCNGRRVFQCNLRGYKTTPKFGRVQARSWVFKAGGRKSYDIEISKAGGGVMSLFI